MTLRKLRDTVLDIGCVFPAHPGQQMTSVSNPLDPIHVERGQAGTRLLSWRAGAGNSRTLFNEVPKNLIPFIAEILALLLPIYK